MTRDEAIKEIDDLRCDIGSAYDDANLSPIWNALGMAIDALKHPREQCIAKIELPEEELEKIFQKILHEHVQVLPPERKTGRWIDEGYIGSGNHQYRCSVCGHVDEQARFVNVPYCWHCGSEMKPKEVPDAE